MKYLKELISRFKHGLGRPKQAIRNILRRLILNIFGVNLSLQTEIQYVDLGFFQSKIITKNIISKAKNIIFELENSQYEHSFQSKYYIEITNVIVNTELNLVYVTGNKEGERLLLKECSSWPTDILLLNSEVPPDKITQIIDCAKIGLPNSGHYHWVSEDLPNYLSDNSNYKTLLYKKANKKSKLLLRSMDTDYINSEKWVFVKKLSFVTKNEELGYIHPNSLNKLKNFQSNLNLKSSIKSDKIYVSRSKTRRSMSWEKQLESYLSQKGYRIIFAEDFSFVDQIALFKEATEIIGIHGAGLTNALWADECTVIELMPINRINRCIEWQTRLSKGTYMNIYFDPDTAKIEDITNHLDTLIF
jgi:hypothetical protein